ncbi:hypothetical protein MferCBS31731_007386 [Microsporum ferrugineum]
MAHPHKIALEGIASKITTGLPGATPRIKYTGMELLQKIAEKRAMACYRDDSQSPFLIVENIPPTILQDFDHVYGDKGPKITANLPEGVLILETMVWKPHEIAARGLESIIKEEIDKMGLRDDIDDCGSARAESNGHAKEPDGSFVLDSHDWPILTVEAGLSEKRSKLAVDARWWLEIEGSETELVITIKINRRTPNITFHRWEKHFPEGQMARRSSRKLGVIMEEVTATRLDGVTYVSGDLNIPFAKIASREEANPNEHDIIVTNATLRRICEKVWKRQNL